MSPNFFSAPIATTNLFSVWKRRAEEDLKAHKDAQSQQHSSLEACIGSWSFSSSSAAGFLLNLQDLRCFDFWMYYDLDDVFWDERERLKWDEVTRTDIIYHYAMIHFVIGFSLQYNITSSSFLKSLAESYSIHACPNKNTHPTQPTSTPNLNPNGDPTEPSHRSGQERMKYIEKVLGDSAEEHAKLLAKQKKEGGSRGHKTLVVFWKTCFFFNPWKTVVYDCVFFLGVQ